MSSTWVTNVHHQRALVTCVLNVSAMCHQCAIHAPHHIIDAPRCVLKVLRCVTGESSLWQQSNLFVHAHANILRHIRMYKFHTDSGPDQFACDALLAESLEYDCTAGPVWTFCLPHQIHLMVCRQLKRMGPYYSQLAQTTHLWRYPNSS